jgi:hypothetical protein
MRVYNTSDSPIIISDDGRSVGGREFAEVEPTALVRGALRRGDLIETAEPTGGQEPEPERDPAAEPEQDPAVEPEQDPAAEPDQGFGAEPFPAEQELTSETDQQQQAEQEETS